MAELAGGISAFIAIAEFGLSLATTLDTFITEAKSAPDRIQRVSDTVLTTSQLLLRVDEIIRGDGYSPSILSDASIEIANRSVRNCEVAIQEIREILQKKGWPAGTTEIKREEFDLSWFSSTFWYWTKPKLEAPLSDLRSIKADLTFLMTTALAVAA